MNTSKLIIASCAATLLAGCATTPSPEQQAKYTEDARKAVLDVRKKLGTELKTQLAASGPATALSVCRDSAPVIAKAVMAEHGVKIRRTTSKPRNPKAVPDAWEAGVLADFEARVAKGEKQESLEFGQFVDTPDGKVFRYARGLLVEPMCVTCHGTPETIPDDVKAKLAELYPQDKATGYKPDMLRGIISLQKPL